MGSLHFRESFEEVARQLPGAQPDRLPVLVAPAPLRIVLGGRRDVGVPELSGDVGQGDPRREELRGEGVAQVFRRPVADSGAVQGAPPDPVPEVLGVEAREHASGRSRLELEPEELTEHVPEAQGESHDACPAALRLLLDPGARTSAVDDERAPRVVLVFAPVDLAPGETGDLAHAKAGVEHGEDCDEGAEATAPLVERSYSARGVAPLDLEPLGEVPLGFDRGRRGEAGKLGRVLDGANLSPGLRLGASLLGARLPPKLLAEARDRARVDEPEIS